MRLSATNVESAVAQKIRTGQWVVTIHLTSNGAASWDRVAQQSFHEFLAIDVGGTVVSAPIIQPAQSSFSPFDGAMEISGALNASTAQSVAADLEG
jgi:preprotein translocase subunit SecD